MWHKPRHPRLALFALALVVSSYVISFFHRFAPASLAETLSATFNTNATSLGLLASIYFYVSMLIQTPAGILVDRLGPRLLLLGSGIIATIGSLVFASAETLSTAIVGRFLISLGASCTFVSMLKLLTNNYPPQRFASLVGLMMLIGNFGSVLAGTPLTLMDEEIGWRNLFIIIAALSAVLTTAQWLSLTAEIKQETRDHEPAFAHSFKNIIREPRMWPNLFVSFGVAGCFMGFCGLWAGPYLIEVQGMSKVMAGNHLSLLFVCFASACLIIGTLSDRLRRRKLPIMVCTIMLCLIWLVMLSGQSLPVTISFPLYALLGLSLSCFTLTWTIAKELSPQHLAGTATSMANTVGFLAAAMLQVLSGWLIDQFSAAGMSSSESYRWGLLPFFIAAIIAMLAATRLSETHAKNQFSAMRELGRQC